MIKNLWNKAVAFFIDYINWCHPVDSKGNEKKPTRFYQFYCWLFWPIPWMDEPCWCCAATRGWVYGIVTTIAAYKIGGLFI